MLGPLERASFNHWATCVNITSCCHETWPYHSIYDPITDSFYFADNVAGDLHDILELNINNALKSLSITEHDTYGVLQAINCSFAANSGVRSVIFFLFHLTSVTPI
jgi:hypothetical protein